MHINSSLSTMTPTTSNLSLVILIFCKKPFTESLAFLRLWSSSFRFKILALEVEVNLYSRVFQTSFKLVIPITREKTCGVRVEFIKEIKVLSLIFQAWNSRLITEVGFPEESRTKGRGLWVVPSMCSIKE